MVAAIQLILPKLQLWQEIILNWKLLLLIVIFVSSKTTAEQQPPVDIGDVTELKGQVQVIRDEPYTAKLDFAIQQNDNVQTNLGRVGITFLDDSVVKLTEHSKLTIDEYVFDPNPSKSKLALNFASGTARFVTGALGRIDKENISIKTPTANIAIRGTDFTCTVDELGRSLIILLPDPNGLSSGEILVTTGMGTVTLNQPYQATTTEVFESKPSSPVILDLNLDLIDNMLIVNPPKENFQLEQEENGKESKNILDIDYLEFEELDQDALAEDNLEFTELDINYLDVNFFEDLLAIVEELDLLKEEELKTEIGSSVQGTGIGQDLETQITTILQGEVISLRREVQQKARIDIDGASSYTIIFIQDGITNTVKINGGGTSTITIKQGS
jgi:hypothetical protein